MLVAIIGSRSLKMDISDFIPEGMTELVTGGVRGIDTCAEQYADERNIPKLIIKPEYIKYGRRAPLVRNETIVDCADTVVAVWDGNSPGTKYAIEYAQKIGKPIYIHIITGTPPPVK